MKKLIYTLLATTLITAFLTGCQNKNEKETGSTSTTSEASEETSSNTEKATSVEVTHSKGTVTVPTDIKKAVVFDYGTLDTIDTLGIEIELAVPTESVPTYLEKYKSVTNAGNIKEPDLEAIFAFEPDVIFISGRQEAYYDQLSEIAPTVYVDLNAETYMDDFKRNVTLLGDLFGKEEVAANKLSEIDASLEETKSITSEQEEKALILLVNDGALSVYGKGTRFGMIHDVLGVKTADENIEVSTHGQSVNFEYLSEVNPDVLFIIDRTVVAGGTNEASSVLDNELVNGTTAAKNNRIVSLNADVWYLSGGGLQSVALMIEEVKNAFAQ